MRKITTEAGQIEKSDIQIAGKKHDKADSQQSGRILSFHRKRTAQIPGQQCDIEKGGRRKEAAVAATILNVEPGAVTSCVALL